MTPLALDATAPVPVALGRRPGRTRAVAADVAVGTAVFVGTLTGVVFLLGLVTLSLAYLYYRHDRGERTF